MIAAGLIWYDPKWKIADPISTLLFSVLVLFTTVRLLKEAINILMEGYDYLVFFQRSSP